jgi:hypothetical protein
VVALPKPSTRAPDSGLLAILLHDAERVVDHQVKAMEELDDKSEHMVGLGVAMLAGSLSIATFLVGKESAPRPDWTFLWRLGAAGAANILAILAFLESYVGFRHGTEVVVGPSLDWVAQKSQDRDWNTASHLSSLLSPDGYPAYARFNRANLRRSAAARRAGLLALAGAVVLYAGALIDIMAKAM